MGKIDDLTAFEGMDADELRKLLLAERRDVARLKAEKARIIETFVNIFSVGRRFSFPLCEDQEIQLIALKMEDHSLPSPLEVPDWRASEASYQEIRKAAWRLAMGEGEKFETTEGFRK